MRFAMFSKSVSVFLLVSTTAFAGGRDSGGGNANICFKSVAVANEVRSQLGISDKNINEITSIQMLDLLEATKPVGFDGGKRVLVKTSPNQSITEFANMLSARLDIFPAFREELKSIMRKLSTNKTKHEAFGLNPEFDHAYRNRIGPNCAIVTVISQQDTDGYTELHLDDRIFSHPAFGDLNKKVAYFHEIVYFEGRQYLGHKNSKNTQLMVSKLLFKDLTFFELTDAVMGLTFDDGKDERVRLLLSNPVSQMKNWRSLGMSYDYMVDGARAFFSSEDFKDFKFSNQSINWVDFALYNSIDRKVRGNFPNKDGVKCQTYTPSGYETALQKYYALVKSKIDVEPYISAAYKAELWKRFSEATARIKYEVGGESYDKTCSVTLTLPGFESLAQYDDVDKFGSPVVPVAEK